MGVAADPPPSCPRNELLRRLVANVDDRVGRRVRGLVVLCQDDAVVVRERASSYHVWQLMIAECQGALAGVAHLRLDCVLRVEPGQ